MDQPKKLYELVHLSPGRTLIATTPEGNIQAIKADVELSVANKDITIIQGNPVISAQGFDRLNKIAGINLVLPSKIEVPGHGTQSNPFFILDGMGNYKFIMVKMVAIGFSPVGNICIQDQALLFNLRSYLLMDCLAKIKSVRGFGKTANRTLLTEKEKQGFFMPVLDEDQGIWMDPGHDEYINIMKEHTQRQRFADRIALGIIKRNCLRHHPAIGIMNVQLEVGGTCHVPILAWRKDLSVEEIRRLAEDKSARQQPGIEVIEEVHTTEEIQPAEAMVVSQEIIADTSAAIGSKEVFEPPKKVVEPTPREKTEIRISEMREALGPERYQAFYNAKVISKRKVEDFSDEQITDYANRLQEHCRKLGV